MDGYDTQQEESTLKPARVDTSALEDLARGAVTREIPDADRTFHSSDVDARACAQSVAQIDRPSVAGYELQERLGAGSFGEVWSGIQSSTGQHVAVKILFRDTDMDLHYMQREVARLASVAEHPHVVTVLDASFTSRPPYLVTPLLASALDRRIGEVTPSQAATWLEQLARALQYVHGKGVIHCDLKPPNVLLDDEMAVRVVDWGQARVAGQSAVSLGTFWYMAPEQALMPVDGDEVVPDVSWDIYALGATVYQLLTRTCPRASEESRRRVSSEGGAARSLSLYCDALKAAPLVPIRQLNAAVDAELAAIVEHCLELDPARRYQSMGEIVDDLNRRREKRPLRARAQRLGYVLNRLIVRNALPLTISLLFVAALTVTIIISFRNVVQARNAATANLAAVEYRTGLDLGESTGGVLWLARAALHDRGVEYQRTAAWQVAATAPVKVVMQHGETGLMAHWEPNPDVFAKSFENVAEFTADGRRLLTAGIDDVVRVWDSASGAPVGKALKHPGPFLHPCISADGSKVATLSVDGVARVWDVNSGAIILTMPVDVMSSAALTPDGRYLVVASADRVRRVDLSTGHELAAFAVNGTRRNRPVDVRVSADGSRIFAIFGREIVVVDAGTGRALARVVASEADPLSPNSAARISADDRYVAFPCSNCRVGVWSLEDGRLLGRVPLATVERILSFDVGRDGRLAGVGSEKTVRAWSEGQVVGLLHDDSVGLVRFSPDGTLLATASSDGSAHVWNVTTGQKCVPPLSHGSRLLAQAFSADGSRLATFASDGQARIWDLNEIRRNQPPPIHLPLGDQTQSGAICVASDGLLPGGFSADGRLAVTSWGRTAAVWDVVGGGRPVMPGIEHPARVLAVSLSKDGTRLLTWCDDRRLRAWSIPKGSEVWSRDALAVSFDDQGGRVAVGSADGRVQLYDMTTLVEAGGAIVTGARVERLYLSPDGRRLAVTGQGGATITAWDTAAGTRSGADIRHGKQIQTARWSRDASRLLTMSNVDSIDPRSPMPPMQAQVWDVATGSAISPPFGTLLNQTGGFSPDGSQVVLGQTDRELHVYDATSGREVGRPMRLGDPICAAAFTPDGSAIACADHRQSVRFFDAVEHVSIAPRLPSCGPLARFAFSADGTMFMAIGDTGYSIWPLRLGFGLPPATLMRDAEARTALTLDAAGDVRCLTPDELRMRRAP